MESEAALSALVTSMGVLHGKDHRSHLQMEKLRLEGEWKTLLKTKGLGSI